MTTPAAVNDPWVARIQEAFQISTSYLDTNYRKAWEDALRHFHGKHASDSKFLKASYRYRSKVFRPKTRAAIRNNEAAAAAAFFANRDVLEIEPENPSDPAQVLSADVNKELVQYRLTRTIPWFVTLLGAFQSAQTIGAVASYNHWRYRERYNGPVIEPETDADGQPVFEDDGTPRFIERHEFETLEDRPDIELIPVENLRIHPAADWRDPIGSSPFVIRMVPMFLYDVRSRMTEVDVKSGQPKWRKADDNQLRAAATPGYDTTRMARTPERQDALAETPTPSETLGAYTIVWCHENFFRDDDGEDLHFWSLGTDHLLTEPQPLADVYLHGVRPITMGCAIIEAHRLYPPGVAELGKQVQGELNTIANQRLDNVKLVLNKRYFGKRGENIDLQSLTRNVAGSVTLMEDPTASVRVVDFADVTGSSYQEQDRLSVEFDDLVGSFSQSSIASNRKLNETVGGMAMLRQGSNALTEYLIRTFAETWVEPTLRQLVLLEQEHETDEVVLAVAAQRARLWQRFGIDKITDELLRQELTLTVNVGYSATNPMEKINSLLLATRTIAEIVQMAPPGMKAAELIKEVYGVLGYKDGARFFDEEAMDQQQQVQAVVAQLQQQIQALSAQLQDKEADRQLKLMLEQLKEAGQMKRTRAQIAGNLLGKHMDLANPVVGERRPANALS